MKYWFLSFGLTLLLLTMGVGVCVIAAGIVWFLNWMLEVHTTIIAIIYAFLAGVGTVFFRKHFFDDGDE